MCSAAFRRLAAMLPAVLLLLVAAGWPARTAPARPATVAQAPGVVVIMYHRFGDARYPSTNIRMEQFRAQLRELAQPQYHVLPLPEIVRRLREGPPLPDRTVGISIDDAYRTIYTHAWPLLKAARLPFTIFVATRGVDRGYDGLLSWAELREMAASGLVTLGDHTTTHPHMVDEGRARNREEIEEGRRRIAQETGQRPTLFAYPYGEYDVDVRQLVASEGFAAAFGQQSGVIGPGADRFALPRFALDEHYGTIERFRLAVNALPLPVEDVIPADMPISEQDNPPLFGLTVAESAGPLDALACYVAGQGRLTLRHIGPRRVEGRPAHPFAVGRTRINCTLPAPDGRWRWFGAQFYRPES